MPRFNLGSFDEFCDVIRNHVFDCIAYDRMVSYDIHVAGSFTAYGVRCTCDTVFTVAPDVVDQAYARRSPNYELVPVLWTDRQMFISRVVEGRPRLSEKASDEHIKPEIRALIRRGNISLTEVRELRANSYEWEALYPALTDEAFIHMVERHMGQVGPARRPTVTYEQSLIHVMVPELVRRLKGEARKVEDDPGVSRFERDVEVG